MIHDFHFLRPEWLLGLVPLLALIWFIWKKNPRLQAWEEICDRHLLEHLIKNKDNKSSYFKGFVPLFLSMFFLILSLSGPSWHRLSVPVYQPSQARVLVLDLSYALLETDLSPNRLTRAKFTLQDLLQRKGIGQFGMIAYTGEAFVVSPLTADGLTIAALLPTLEPDIMPLQGQNLANALDKAAQLIKQAGFTQGNILVFTPQAPSAQAISQAKELALSNITSSIIPLNAENPPDSAFAKFARAGKGELLPASPTETDLDNWINLYEDKTQFNLSKNNSVPLWKDDGRWLLLPAALFLLLIFRRGWLQRVMV